MQQDLSKYAEQIYEKVKTFVQENKVAVATTAAFIAIFGLINIFGQKKDGKQLKNSSTDKNLKKSSRRRYNSEGGQSQQRPAGTHFQTDGDKKGKQNNFRANRLVANQKNSEEFDDDLAEADLQQNRGLHISQDPRDKLFFQMHRNLGLNQS